MATLSLDKHVKWRRGTTTAVNAYAGEAGEFVLDTTKQTVVLLSGTAGTNYPLAKESKTITAGDGVAIVVNGSSVNSTTLADDFTVKANLADLLSTSGGLKLDNNGKLALDFTLNYTAATGVVTAIAADGTTVLGSTTIPSHTSALASATLETASVGSPVNNQTSGTFIHMVFNLTNGSTSDFYINVTSLIDIYTAGNGLQMNASDDHQFEVKPANGIEVTAAGVAVKVKDNEEILIVDSNGLYIDSSALAEATAVTVVSDNASNIITGTNATGAMLKIDTNVMEMNSNNELTVITDMGVLAEPNP